jgi:hypothetical protein
VLFGGDDNDNNLQALCRCNRSKGANAPTTS